MSGFGGSPAFETASLSLIHSRNKKNPRCRNSTGLLPRQEENRKHMDFRLPQFSNKPHTKQVKIDALPDGLKPSSSASRYLSQEGTRDAWGRRLWPETGVVRLPRGILNRRIGAASQAGSSVVHTLRLCNLGHPGTQIRVIRRSAAVYYRMPRDERDRSGGRACALMLADERMQSSFQGSTLS